MGVEGFGQCPRHSVQEVGVFLHHHDGGTLHGPVRFGVSQLGLLSGEGVLVRDSRILFRKPHGHVCTSWDNPLGAASRTR